MKPKPSRFGFLGVLREMAWAFLGIRDRRNYERATRSNPVHIVLAGVLLTALLVMALIGAVKLAMHTAEPRPGAGESKVMVDQQGGE
ncbi:MAG: hypothetical protein Kow0073_03330 [Immundisolibacter sp.]